MIERILLAVDDSPAALAAGRLAVATAQAYGARLRVVTVVEDGLLDERLSVLGNQGLKARRASAGSSVLSHVARAAADAGVSAEVLQLEGEAGRRILESARRWPADLVVIGRSERRGAGDPYIGSVTRQVLEFAEQPVLVAPPPPPPGAVGRR